MIRGLHYTTFNICCILSLGFMVMSCQDKSTKEETQQITLKVSSPHERENAFLNISLENIKSQHADFNEEGFTVFYNGNEISSEVVNMTDGEQIVCLIPELAEGDGEVVINFDPEENHTHDYGKKTQAELSHKVGGEFQERKYIGGEFQNVNDLRVPDEHTDHSYFIRYEGPGWESDMVGYRYYLDWRNGIDVFGKKTSRPVLQDVGQDGFDSYHEPADWGMDILKVGSSLGVGSLGTFEDGKARRVDETDSVKVEIGNNGNLYSSIETNYYGWKLRSGKTDIASRLSIHAGTRMTKHEVSASGAVDNFCTGLIKDDKAELLIGGKDQKYTFVATYGQQSLAGDNLGIAVIIPTEQLKEITEDSYSHVAVVEPLDGSKITYYFLAAWEQEPEGIKDKESFKAYLEQMVQELSNPLEIRILR